MVGTLAEVEAFITDVERTLIKQLELEAKRKETQKAIEIKSLEKCLKKENR